MWGRVRYQAHGGAYELPGVELREDEPLLHPLEGIPQASVINNIDDCPLDVRVKETLGRRAHTHTRTRQSRFIHVL